MEKLAKDQSAIGKAIERRVENFYKTSRARKNLRYFRTQLELLDGEWSTFIKNHSELQRFESSNSSHLYFMEDFFGQVKSTYDDFKSEIEDNITSLVKEEEQVLLGTTEVGFMLKQIRTQKALVKSLERVLQDLEVDSESIRSKAFCDQSLADISQLWKSISDIHHCVTAEVEIPEYDEEAYIQLEKRYKAISIKLLEAIENQFDRSDGTAVNRQSFVRLPKISIPTFSGDYSKWKQFHDLFSNLIECQPMANSQKMFYLKSNLAGEAERIIQHLEISDVNYNTAWKLLKNRYNNKRLIVSSFLKSIFSIPISSFDTAQSLKRLHDIVQEAVLGIKNQGLDISNWDAMLLHLLLQKVDKETHRLFEQGLEQPREIPGLNIFLKFLEARFQLLETLGEKKEEAQSKQKRSSKYSFLSTNCMCELCKKYHVGIHQCTQFLKLTPEKRFETAKKLQYCINCLKKGHSSKECKSQACHKCNKRHNTLLHFDVEIKTPLKTSNDRNANSELPTVHTAITSPDKKLTSSYVFLGTAVIIVKAKHGQLVKCRAILDSGSQLNFITERFVQKLGLKGSQQKIQISGIGASRVNSQGVLHLNINSENTRFSASIEAVIIPEITNLQPSQTFNIESWPLPQNIKLADPEFHRAKTIDLLLGADIYSELMSNGQIKMSADLPTLQNSVFGWVVLGRIRSTALEQSYFCGISTSSLDEHLQRFWNLEECHVTNRPMTTLERECDHYYNQNTRREITGRVVVKLPFKREPECVGKSREIAMRRFTQLEKRLDRDQKLKREYKHFMDELIQLQHMTPISFNEIPKNHYFMPHHCVMKPESTTTKLRVVFDASCKTSSNISLNDILQVGPTIQDDLFTILVRFRTHKYAFTADITKMYRQIQVTDEDQCFQLILWRENSMNPIQCYKLRTVTYGTACAPYLATKTLQYLSEQHKVQYPLGAKAVKQDFYVDDLITGANDLSEAIQIQTEVKSLLQQAGMPLRKWCANHRELLETIPSEELETLTSFQSDGESFTKSLGLIWYPQSDSFAIKVKLPITKQVSKRTILADIARIYDPLGLINPVISKAKIFIQQLWQLKLDWDAQIPEDLAQKWQTFREELKLLSNITIPRHLFSRNRTKSTQLHAFSDASERAYGVVIFLRSIDSRGSITVRLVCSKSRVAPVKVTTIPRLELCAAHLMVELVTKLKATLTTDETFFWTDSSITLSWIRSGFAHHRKWCANHRELLETIPSEELETLTSFQSDGESFTKSLGLIWYPHSDSFAIKVKLPITKQVSKRTILADIARIYDPLGLKNPVISKAKIFIQQLWQLKLDWDAQIPEDLAQKWQTFREELKLLSNITIPRHLFSRNRTKSTQLHAFSDASERAYGVVIFLRSIDSRGSITVRLVCSKSRVAPVKVTTIPRLELCAAHLMVELVTKLKATLTTDETFFWTDSSITLSWIRSSSTSFKTFVANRVSYIQEKTLTNQWRHVPTKQNPADLLSRGTTPKTLLESELWFHGPQFLQDRPERWPNTNCPNIEVEEEKRSTKSALTSSVNTSAVIDSINHRNSFKHLQHVVAYMKRFAHNVRQVKENRILSATLSPRELQDAMHFLLREVQTNAFADEIRQIKELKFVSTKNRLSKLTPIICDKGLIRVGGRLHQSNLPYDAKHQILLPYSNEIVTLLAKQLHEKNLHAGPQALLAIMRQRFWPLRGKSLTKSIVNSCIRCYKAKPKLLSQIMGTLPKERIEPARVFTNVGIDFCGPIYVHYRIRGKVPTKTYIAVFVCFCTKAVHLELVSDLTKDSFIGALKRFVARRGRPSKIFCDNATNFTGASNDLKELKTLLIDSETRDQIIKHCSDESIEWQFIPPRSPHFGGLWEAAVKSAKYHLKRVIDSTSLTYEELHTIVTEVEAILNSRPLTPLSHDANDLEALTPGHFIIGEALNTIPNPEADDPNYKPRRRLEIIQACKANFWKRWSQEYLQQLQIRTKWRSSAPPLLINTLVLIKQDNVPPLKWPMGRVIEQHKGPDGRVRVVDIKVQGGTIRRAIHNLCPLPIEDYPKVNSTKTPALSDEPKTSSTSLIAMRNTSRRSKRKITPINTNWLMSPAFYPLSSQPRENESSQVRESSPDRKKRKSLSPLTGSKLTKIALALFVLFVPALQAATLEQATNKVIELTPIEKNTPFYLNT